MMKTTTPTSSSRRRLARLLATLLVPAAALSLAGCSTTDGTTAQSSPSVIRHVVSRGHIEKGYSEAEVASAWGNPSSKETVQTPQGPLLAWTYVKSYNGHGGGHYGVPRGWTHNKRGGLYFSSDSYYPAPHTAQTLQGVARTEVPVKRAYFKDGTVVSFQERHDRGEE